MDDREKRCASGGWLHELYQGVLASEAFARHQTSVGLNGVTHEIAYVWRHNLNPASVNAKGWARLNPNPRDPLFDIVFANGSGVQLKDTISPAGVRATMRRAPDYGQTLICTPETVDALAQKGVKAASSRISSGHNSGVALRAGGVQTIPVRALIHNVKGGAISGAVVGGASALIDAYLKCSRGEATWDEVLPSVLREIVVSAVSGGGAALAGTLVAAMLPPGPATVLIGLIIGLCVAGCVSVGLNAFLDARSESETVAYAVT